MSAIPKQEYIEYYRECEEKRYRDFLDSLSDSISFDSDKMDLRKSAFKKPVPASEQGYDLLFHGSRTI